MDVLGHLKRRPIEHIELGVVLGIQVVENALRCQYAVVDDLVDGADTQHQIAEVLATHVLGRLLGQRVAQLLANTVTIRAIILAWLLRNIPKVTIVVHSQATAGMMTVVVHIEEWHLHDGFVAVAVSKIDIRYFRINVQVCLVELQQDVRLCVVLRVQSVVDQPEEFLREARFGGTLRYWCGHCLSR